MTISDPSKPEGPRGPGRLVFLVVGVVFFFLPVAALLVGVRAKPIENKPLATAPHWRLSWDVIPEITDYVNSHLPFRDAAVRANTNLSLKVFGEAPSTAVGTGGPAGVDNQQQTGADKPEDPEAVGGKVTIGRNGWLYLAEEFHKECQRLQPPAQVIANLQRLNDLLTASGRTFIFTVAPDKSTVVPEYLPANYPEKACAQASKQETFRLLAASGNPAYVDMHALITGRQKQEKRPYYLKKDTHWNGLATTALTREVMKKIDPAMLKDALIEEGKFSYQGDLTQLLGAPETDETQTATITRPGVTVAPLEQVSTPSGLTAFRMPASGQAAMVDAPTLLVGDSFSRVVLPQMAPFFSNLLRVDNGTFAADQDAALKQVMDSKVIMLVWVERNFTSVKSGLLWSTSFLDALEARLAGR
jgi:hypothetical protein